MAGSRAYANYCAAYNDCSPTQLPRFTNVNDYVEHAAEIAGEKDVLTDPEKFQEFMREVLGTEDDCSGSHQFAQQK